MNLMWMHLTCIVLAGYNIVLSAQLTGTLILVHACMIGKCGSGQIISTSYRGLQ